MRRARSRLTRSPPPPRAPRKATRGGDGGRRRARRARSKEDPREAKARDRGQRVFEARFAQALLVNARPPLDQARRAPILRANPYPEVTDPSCRLPLPTFFYRLEALHLGDLLRIWVRAGARPPRGPSPDFQGPKGAPGHRRNCGALRVPFPLSALGNSRELERSNRKENSSQASRRLLRVWLGYPDEHAPLKARGPDVGRFRDRVPEWGPDSLSPCATELKSPCGKRSAFASGFP